MGEGGERGRGGGRVPAVISNIENFLNTDSRPCSHQI